MSAVFIALMALLRRSRARFISMTASSRSMVASRSASLACSLLIVIHTLLSIQLVADCAWLESLVAAAPSQPAKTDARIERSADQMRSRSFLHHIAGREIGKPYDH